MSASTTSVTHAGPVHGYQPGHAGVTPGNAPASTPDTGHLYDGIREYDNPTPGWWHAIFYATVLFCAAYFIVYEADPDAPTLAANLEKDIAAENAKMFAQLPNLKADQDSMLSLMGQPKWMSFGQSMFRANCISCHGKEGQGEVGPNLTDDSYKSVTLLPDIIRVIREGAAAGAMPSWKGRLSDNEVILVASYVASLRGKNLPGPRGPEGNAAPPWPPIPAAAPAPAKPAGK